MLYLQKGPAAFAWLHVSIQNEYTIYRLESKYPVILTNKTIAIVDIVVVIIRVLPISLSRACIDASRKILYYIFRNNGM